MNQRRMTERRGTATHRERVTHRKGERDRTRARGGGHGGWGEREGKPKRGWGIKGRHSGHDRSQPRKTYWGGGGAGREGGGGVTKK